MSASARTVPAGTTPAMRRSLIVKKAALEAGEAGEGCVRGRR